MKSNHVTVKQLQKHNETEPQQIRLVTESSLNGVGGALVFWMVMFLLSAINNIISTVFRVVFANQWNFESVINDVAFPLLLSAGFIASVILIALKKRLAIFVVISTLLVATISSLFSTILITTAGAPRFALALTIAYFFVLLIIYTMVAFYFLVSKRVKQTLVL